MNEDFIHYLWKYKKFELSSLKTTQQQEIVLKSVGLHNMDNSGPDFFNALISIDGQKWAGNVEIHVKSSDWYAHNHENDRAYDNVILHVVWEDDISVFRRDNTLIPTLQLKNYVNKKLLSRYFEFFEANTTKGIACSNQFSTVPDFIMINWQERLYLERLEQKSKLILKLLKETSNNWEAVLFILLAKSFGSKANGEAFLNLANSIDFSILRKCNKNAYQLEALLFGQAGLLDREVDDEYVRKLQQEYRFLKSKFQLQTYGAIPLQFFRIRPSNFPTIRLAQLAGLYHKNDHLFSCIINANTTGEIYELFKIEISDFWKNHYTFDKQSPQRRKKLTKSFIDLILMNAIIPLKFIYVKNLGVHSEENIFELISSLPPEKNSCIDGFSVLKAPINNAMQSQAMIQLKNNYCDRKLCLHCAIGNYLVNQD